MNEIEEIKEEDEVKGGRRVREDCACIVSINIRSGGERR
jgi:hypothetical protein